MRTSGSGVNFTSEFEYGGNCSPLATGDRARHDCDLVLSEIGIELKCFPGSQY
jgi:hypothetical protein